jgi:hypothetical protein
VAFRPGSKTKKRQSIQYKGGRRKDKEEKKKSQKSKRVTKGAKESNRVPTPRRPPPIARRSI